MCRGLLLSVGCMRQVSKSSMDSDMLEELSGTGGGYHGKERNLDEVAVIHQPVRSLRRDIISASHSILKAVGTIS